VISTISEEIFDPLTNQFQPFPISGLQLKGPLYPFHHDTHAQLCLDAPLRVCDLAERVHLRESLGAGTQVHELDVQALPAGMYLVQLQSAAGNAVRRIAVQR
jgi:hypothetical protein